MIKFTTGDKIKSRPIRHFGIIKGFDLKVKYYLIKWSNNSNMLGPHQDMEYIDTNFELDLNQSFSDDLRDVLE